MIRKKSSEKWEKGNSKQDIIRCECDKSDFRRKNSAKKEKNTGKNDDKGHVICNTFGEAPPRYSPGFAPEDVVGKKKDWGKNQTYVKEKCDYRHHRPEPPVS